LSREPFEAEQLPLIFLNQVIDASSDAFLHQGFIEVRRDAGNALRAYPDLRPARSTIHVPVAVAVLDSPFLLRAWRLGENLIEV